VSTKPGELHAEQKQVGSVERRPSSRHRVGVYSQREILDHELLDSTPEIVEGRDRRHVWMMSLGRLTVRWQAR